MHDFMLLVDAGCMHCCSSAEQEFVSHRTLCTVFKLRRRSECLVQAIPMEEEEGAGGGERGDVEAPDMIPLDGSPEGAATSAAKQKPGSRGRARGRGRGGRGRDAKVGRPCSVAVLI